MLLPPISHGNDKQVLTECGKPNFSDIFGVQREGETGIQFCQTTFKPFFFVLTTFKSIYRETWISSAKFTIFLLKYLWSLAEPHVCVRIRKCGLPVPTF